MESLSNNLPNTILYPEKKVKRKYRFHIPGFLHLPCASRYYPCAFTNKILKFADMMMSLGHEVFVYAAEGSDVKCTEFIQTHTLQDIRDVFGENNPDFEIGYDWTKEVTFKFDMGGTEKELALQNRVMVKMVNEINKRVREDDFIIFTMGTFHNLINENVKKTILKVENGIAYRNTMCRFKAYESEFFRNFELGLRTVGKDTPNGAFYDRVIPNFFRPEEFPIESVKVNKKDRGINGEEYILYIGRLIPRKGINIAVRLAQETKTKIYMAGQGGLTGVSPYVKLLGVLDPIKRNYYMSRAKAVIVPTVYVEPFGGVGVETMLSGTPILTTNFGVFPEYNINGLTGYRCDLFRDFVNALNKVDDLDRMAIRKHAERYLMDNIKWEYQKWFDELYQFHLGVKTGNKEKQQNIWFEKF